MKARVIETNEIEELQEDMNNDYFTKDGVHFKGFELDFNVEQPDYWEKLKHQYAGMAMQQMVNIVNEGYEYVYEETAMIALNFATALVNKLKEEEKCC
jgi:hypothetical protein